MTTPSSPASVPVDNRRAGQPEALDLDRMTSAVMRHEWQPGHDFSPATAHMNHQYDASCAVCRGDVRAVLAVALEAT